MNKKVMEKASMGNYRQTMCTGNHKKTRDGNRCPFKGHLFPRALEPKR